ncbi:uncharacterized protein MYCFIDRAFT_176766 [Pseudocercospora fijiensis CIRAD86]|uniref:Uncharacterized protein n=1 Tax=Pseudocercospora fijiensis (strain CIRAD86) TaxID=383855 RepID=M2YUR9_PSEFD|nr:uncharacterized protein MYCFIDRAFT_176766 [Pseudocercospora fijiensis CIRAD86]EME81490.1 hypothetical protein MYCFIDRAFT_176766 [Pseudocercospora fijiensis CIRAD86]
MTIGIWRHFIRWSFPDRLYHLHKDAPAVILIEISEMESGESYKSWRGPVGPRMLGIDEARQIYTNGFANSRILGKIILHEGVLEDSLALSAEKAERNSHQVSAIFQTPVLGETVNFEAGDVLWLPLPLHPSP